jgi:hypothetical protein
VVVVLELALEAELGAEGAVLVVVDDCGAAVVGTDDEPAGTEEVVEEDCCWEDGEVAGEVDCPVAPAELAEPELPGVVELFVEEAGAAVVVLDEPEFVRSPLLFSCVSICCWTEATSEATAVGVPFAPSADNASSFFRSASSSSTSVRDGWALSVTTS